MSSDIDKTVEKLLELAGALDSGRVSIKDFEEVIKVLVQFAKETRDLTDSEVQKLDGLVQTVISDLKRQTKESLTYSESSIKVLRDALKRHIEQVVLERAATLKSGDKGEQGDPGETIVGPPGPPGKDGSPDTGQEILKKVQKLPEDERWEIEDVNGLEEELKRLLKARSTTIFGGAPTGHLMQSYDLSSQLNGVLRTFTLPAFYQIVSVHLSSFPGILRPTTDYTWNANTFTITFTSEIPDNSIATGQTCIVLFTE